MTENFKAPVKTRAALYGLLILTIFAPFIVGAVGGNYWVRVLDFVLLYTMLVLGLDIVVGFAGLLGLDYIAFYAVGAYMMVLLGSLHLPNQFKWIHNLFPSGLYLIVWWVTPPGAGLAALFGILLGTPVLKLCGDHLAIMTLGFDEITRIFMDNFDRPVNITNGPKDINLIEPVKISGFDFSKRHSFSGIRFDLIYVYCYLFMILVAIIIIVCLRLQNSRIGHAWVALHEDEIAVKAMDANTRNIKLLASAMDASFGGMSGAMFASFQGFVSPESFVLWESIYVLTIVVLGGTGHIPGVILGGTLPVGFQGLLHALAEPVQNKLFDHVIVEAGMPRQLLFGLAMVVVMLYRPSGLWSPSRKEDRPQKQRAGGLSRI